MKIIYGKIPVAHHISIPKREPIRWNEVIKVGMIIGIIVVATFCCADTAFR